MIKGTENKIANDEKSAEIRENKLELMCKSGTENEYSLFVLHPFDPLDAMASFARRLRICIESTEFNIEEEINLQKYYSIKASF